MVKKRVKSSGKKVSKNGETKRGKRARISTGVTGFDKIVDGGFLDNSINLVVGSSGSGKSIFSVQFLVEGIKKGEKCLYITFEEKKDEFFQNMQGLGFDLYGLEKKGDFVFLEYTPEKVKTMLEEGGGSIENIILTKKIKRVVIDSITSFELLFDDDLKKREASLSLFGMLRKWDCTTLLTYEADPEDKTSQTLEFESDSIILFYFRRKGAERKRLLEVLKMRGTKHESGLYEFEMGKNGIKIKNKK